MIVADGGSNVSNEPSEHHDGDVSQQGDLRALVEGSPGFQAGSKLTALFYSFCIRVGISLDPSADRYRCLMP